MTWVFCLFVCLISHSKALSMRKLYYHFSLGRNPHSSHYFHPGSVFQDLSIPLLRKSCFQGPSHTSEGICPASAQRSLTSGAVFPEGNCQTLAHIWVPELGKQQEIKTNEVGRSITPHWKPKSHRKPHTLNSDGDTFQGPPADSFSYGWSRCRCQFGHQGVSRSGVFTLFNSVLLVATKMCCLPWHYGLAPPPTLGRATNRQPQVLPFF